MAAGSAGHPAGPAAVGLGPDAPVYVISVAAELSGLHPQTLRQYDRLGLVTPGRTPGGGRRYSARDIEHLREVQRLTAMGVGLEAVKRVLELEDQVAALRARVAELEDELARTADRVHASYRRDLVPVRGQSSLVVWRPARR
ncbi:heat shock protein transcriptional repressor HspR [Vallicoccus soli]|uniref:MerR family transcriptional regulator n=1 Tax=Vallicoccus soli TaxID=2339232 RepID=A0A3A3YSH3_9ACTN|nr:helix-turn-helix transcriptional regulator [Vallicoccus soli]RJK94360.1 MerR family transcriptional regulator [Vallicoccus soli]